MSIKHPWIFYFFAFMLLPHQQFVNRGQQLAVATYQFNNAYDYLDSNDRDFAYYQEGGEAVELDDDETPETSNLIPDRQPLVAKEETEPDVKQPMLQQTPVRRASSADDNQSDNHATSELQGNECKDSDSSNSVAKDTQDAIDHVTCLIKSMREHAIAIIKNMNELETDLLSSNDDDSKSNECPPDPCGSNSGSGSVSSSSSSDCGTGGSSSSSGSGGSGSSSSSTCGTGGSSDSDSSSNAKAKCFSDGDSSTNDTKGSCHKDTDTSNKCNTNTNNNNVCSTNNNDSGSSDSKTCSTNINKMKSNCNINLDAGQNPIVVNEWSLPMKNDGTISKAQSAQELMGQAQDAVRSWKAQIESCKRVLDDAVAQAAETDKQTSNADSHNRQNQDSAKLRNDPYGFLNLRKPSGSKVSATSDGDKSKTNILSSGKVVSNSHLAAASPATPAALHSKNADNTGLKGGKAAVVAAATTATAAKTTGAVKDTPPAASTHSSTDDIMKNAAAAKTNMIRRDFKPVRLLKAKNEERKRKYSGKYDSPRSRNSRLWGI